MNILVEDLIHGPHVTLAEDPDGPPAQGYSRTNSVTGCTITRISDVSDLYAEFPDTRPDDRYPYALNPGRGLT
ncbi:hypothetical protein KKH23_08425, partial [Patescibacteria group bacterium]|nr:hypothetical protein [Patescibacteria group bacterium]